MIALATGQGIPDPEQFVPLLVQDGIETLVPGAYENPYFSRYWFYTNIP
jgi:hypothetical protein